MIPETDLRYSVRVIGGSSIDSSSWPTPDEGALSKEYLARYLERKVAVTLFLQGAPSNEIKRATNLGAKQAYRLIRERCLEMHADGQVYGWRGLIPHLHVRPYDSCLRLRRICTR